MNSEMIAKVVINGKEHAALVMPGVSEDEVCYNCWVCMPDKFEPMQFIENVAVNKPDVNQQIYVDFGNVIELDDFDKFPTLDNLEG